MWEGSKKQPVYCKDKKCCIIHALTEYIQIMTTFFRVDCLLREMNSTSPKISTEISSNVSNPNLINTRENPLPSDLSVYEQQLLGSILIAVILICVTAYIPVLWVGFFLINFWINIMLFHLLDLVEKEAFQSTFCLSTFDSNGIC